MKPKFGTFVIFAFLYSSLNQQSFAQSTKVEIFYETLNDVVRRFFVEQFQLVSSNLLDQIDLRLYPYGRTINDGTSYICPYGDKQCQANKLHACLIKSETIQPGPVADSQINQGPVSRFVNCFFKNRYAKDNLEDLGNACLPNDSNADWAEIWQCMNTNMNMDFETITGELTSAVSVDGLAVRISGVVNGNAKTNLVGQICAALAKIDGICTQTTQPAKLKLAIYYEAFNRDVGNYLVKQFGLYYNVLDNFVDIELIPYGNTQFDEATQEYSCAEGDAQCISNKFQALVMDEYINKPKNGDPVSGPRRAVAFVSCLFQSAQSLSAILTCANQKLQPDQYRTFIRFIKQNSDEVRIAFDTMRMKTLAVAPNGLPRVPLVTVNGQVNFNAFDDLVQEVCNQYSSVQKASICTKANLTVLYEALNHQSRTFILEQLKPVFANLHNLINLRLFPAGRAVIVPGQGFECPGGVDQCTAMKLQACALEFFWTNNNSASTRQEVFDFVWCVTKNKRMLSVIESAEICSKEFLKFDAWFTIHGCFVDGTGDAIFGEYIEETNSLVVNVASRSIPIVIFNGEEVEDLSNIKSHVCAFYDEYDRPDYCDSDMSSKVKVKVFYESMSEQSKHFFITQFNPWYVYIEELVNIELYPAGNVLETNSTGGACDSDATDSTCMANKLQALLIDRYFKSEYRDSDFIDGTLRAMKFFKCAFGHPNWKDNIYQAYQYCTEEELIFDDWFNLLVTAKSPYGATIYKNVLDITTQFKVDNGLSSFEVVPWISMDNNMHNKRAAVDLLEAVCNQYSGIDKPLECTPVEVELYYSAINHQSRRFFLDQLIPTLRNLRERVHLQLIPYGVVDPNQSIEQECAAKDRICHANKVQACAITKYFSTDLIENSIQWDGRNQTLSFLYCLFKNIDNLDIDTLAEQCANRKIIYLNEVLECSYQVEGDELLSEMRSKTMGQYQSMEHAPWIVINGLRSSLAESDLQHAVCDSMLGDKPNACYQVTPAKVKVQFHYSSLDSNSAKYVINELYPNFRLLEEIFDFELIPFGLTEVLSQADGNYTLICPNGVDECQGNLIHACIYQQFVINEEDTGYPDEYDRKLMFMQFLNCYFTSSFYPSKNIWAAEACTEQMFGDFWSPVEQCAQSNLGVQLLLNLQTTKMDQLQPHLTNVPWITVNGRYSYSIEHHIRRTVCDVYSGTEKPLECYRIYSVPQPMMVIHYEPGDVDSRAFFNSSLLSDIVTHIAQLSLVPFGRSTYSNDTVKTCVHDDSCEQYLQHICMINLYYQNYQKKVLETIACTFGDLIHDPNVVNLCVNDHLKDINSIDPWLEIETCITDRGDSLMLESAALVQALTPHISHVPWIVINGEHNLEAEDNQLVNELCSMYYLIDKPSLCQQTLLDVEVYYETLNSDVNYFFLEQLSQYGEYLDEIGQFTFIPYGSTTIESNGNFTCVSGDSQCEGNRIHTCIIKRFYNQTSEATEENYYENRIRFANFLKCTSTRETNGETNAANIANECLDENFGGDYWRDVHLCAFGPEGDELYQEMGRLTDLLSPRLTSAPVITIGSEQNSNALINFFQALCNSYNIVRAPLCSTLPNLSVKVGIYFSGNEAGQKYFVEQVLSFYREILLSDNENVAKLHKLISPDLVAWGDTQYDPSNTDNPFICSNGINECYINRFFACVNHHHSTEPRSTLHIIQFALCFFTQSDALTNTSDVLNVCANRVWLSDPFAQLEQCATDNSKEAYEIFLKMKSKTENNYPILNSFPAVTINNVRDPKAEANLLESSCLNYKGYDHPAECELYLTPVTTEASPEPTASTTPVPTTTAPQRPETTTMNTTKLIAIFALLVSVIISRILI